MQGEEAVELQALDVETEDDERVEVSLARAGRLADVLCMAAPCTFATLSLRLVDGQCSLCQVPVAFMFGTRR